MAFCKGMRALTKCGQIVSTMETTAFHTNCPECQDRSRWPTKEQQKAL